MAHILVVDDESDVTAMLKFVLEKDGHTVQTAGNGTEALSALGLDPVNEQTRVPDLAIMDMSMPGMDGQMLCTRMYADLRTKTVPILMLTGNAAMRALHERTPNVSLHIDKPFDPPFLSELIGGMLGGKD